MAKYTEGFKRKAVALLKELNDKGIVIVDGLQISNVRQLCFHLGISSWSIYNWKEAYYFIDNIPEVEIEDFEGLSAKKIRDGKYKRFKTTDAEKKAYGKRVEKELQGFLELPVQDGIGKTTGENKVKFGIDFWMHVARNLGLKNYRKYKSLAQLKLAIGNELIRDSGLVDMNKASKKLKVNGDKL